ncbi:MAG: VWA domain-containing protein [Salinibacter sp.]|uniref:VWA domain-containing protein n=1 Tax=Salinibacter sp. TaxID=2065818 RepID=UPI002FC31DA9
MMSSLREALVLLLVPFFLLIPDVVQGQEPGSREKLQELAKQFASEWEQERAEVEVYAEQRGIPIRRETEDGRTIILKRIVNGQPLYEMDLNREGAITSSVDEVHPGGGLGLSLTGASETLGIWEVGDVPLASHQEFEDSGGQSRINQQDNASVDDHATHVAGTMIAAGVDNDAQGMAFEAELDAWDSNADNSEMATAAGNGLGVSNHSYGTITGWRFDTGDNIWKWYGNPSIDSEEDWGFGFYGSDAQRWDEIAYNAPKYVIVKSAGNDRIDEPGNQPVTHVVAATGDTAIGVTRDPDGGQNGYDSVPRRGTAKNIITVGAVEAISGGYSSPSDVQMSTFSAWGPTDDGRIKPDLVANGVGVYSSTYDPKNPNSDNEYESKRGTSMSTPMVSGSIGLLQEHYKNLNNGDMPLSSTIKALLIHSADDATGNDGPDYRHGWGLMNVEQAADLITTDANAEDLIREEELSENETFEYKVSSDGSSPLRATVTWTDPEGDSPSVDLDPNDQILVNDLDVRVEGPNGNMYEPFILNPSKPGNSAQTGDNTRDNVEQVFVSNTSKGNYTISVSHKKSIKDGPQSFSLVTSGATPLSELEVTFNEVRTSFFPMITSVVTITDSEGNIVTGLNGENFEMEEEGASETIVDVDEIRESGGNVSSSLVLDRSGSMRGGALADAKEAAKTFVDQLKVGDQASVISFSNGVRIDEPFTSDVGALKAAIDGLSAGGGTALYDGMIQGIEEIELEANSPAVLALTDGQENESSNSKQDVIDLANQAGVPVYTIGLGGSVNTDDLQDIADQTGGRFFQAPNSSDLETIYQEISQQLSSRYEVTHLTSNILLDGTERTIELTASTGGGASDTESTTYTAPDFQIPFVANFGSNPDAGETAQASVDVGSESQPADDLFRATFTVEYDAENLDVVSDGPGSFFGNDVEYRSTINDSTGTIDVGIRNQAGKNTSLKNILAKRASVDNNSQNQGDLVQIEFSADEDAPSGKNYNLSVNNVSAADADGNPIAAEVAPTLLSPTTQATSVVSFPTLDWEIDGVDQEYRVQLATDSSFQPIEIDRTTSNTRLSLQSLDKGTAYFWRVRAENAENGPWSDVSSFTTRAAELQADVSRSFGDASGSEDYELVALPGAVDRSLKGTISGEAGLDWQAYWDDGSSENYLQEFDESSTFAFRPGRGFWVTSTETWSFEDRIETVDLRSDTSYAIALHEGWNIVSNPYRQGIEWDRVKAANDDSLQALWRFGGAFTQAETFASAQTGEAFYFLNDRGLDSLTVPYPNALPSDTGGTEASTERLALTARPRGEEKPVSTVHIRIAEDAEEGLGRGDVVAPPNRFSTVSLRLEAPEDVAERKRLLAAERRPLSAETGAGTTFDLRLRTNTEGPILLSASGLDAVENRKVALLNSSTGQSYDLRARQAVTLQRVDSTSLQLAVGDASFIEDKRQSVVPDEVVLTSYPNPFRRQATVEYALPEEKDVRLAVYDVLGRRVAVLEDGSKQAGRHRVTLSSDGLASGVYFGRLEVGEQTVTQKITVVR